MLSCAPKTEFDLCDLENQGHDSKMNRLLGSLWRRHIPGFKLIAAKLSELFCQNCDFGQTGRSMDRRTEREIERLADNMGIE